MYSIGISWAVGVVEWGARVGVGSKWWDEARGMVAVTGGMGRWWK